jgi:hypothetical protein
MVLMLDRFVVDGTNIGAPTPASMPTYILGFGIASIAAIVIVGMLALCSKTLNILKAQAFIFPF